MSINNDKESETIESKFSKLNLININHDNCYQPKKRKFWCKECVPSCIIEWTSENSEIDNFIKDTIYNAKYFDYYSYIDKHYALFLEWVPFDRFEDIKQIGEGGFAKVYSAWPFKKTRIILFCIIYCILYKLINIWISTRPSFNYSKWVTYFAL